MIVSNNDDGYKAVQPLGENMMIHPSFHATPEQRDGLFYRSDLPIDLDEATARILGRSGMVQDYQYWVDTGWKKEHSTYEAVERFGDKLYEEHQEFNIELRPVIHSDSETVSADNIISEAGDVLWCATALASCATADLDAGFKSLLYRYVRGVQHIGDNNKAIEPKWRQAAGDLSIKYDQLTIRDIDDLLSVGFEPLPSTVMNIYDPEEPDGGISSHLINSIAICATLRNQTEEQYGWGGEAYVMPEMFKIKSRHVGELVAGLYLETTWIALSATEATLEDILHANVTKIDGRLQTNTIDKADGKRS